MPFLSSEASSATALASTLLLNRKRFFWPHCRRSTPSDAGRFCPSPAVASSSFTPIWLLSVTLWPWSSCSFPLFCEELAIFSLFPGIFTNTLLSSALWLSPGRFPFPNVSSLRPFFTKAFFGTATGASSGLGTCCLQSERKPPQNTTRALPTSSTTYKNLDVDELSCGMPLLLNTPPFHMHIFLCTRNRGRQKF